MYRLLIDTGVLIDACMPGRPGREEAKRVIERCSGYSGEGDLGFAASLSLKDAYYVLEREYDEPTARRTVGALMDMLPVAPVGGEECERSLRSNEPDFEDGLVRAVAELNDIDFIITRDAKAYARSTVRNVTPAEYLEICGAEIGPVNPLT